jgi:hypothetical protein
VCLIVTADVSDLWLRVSRHELGTNLSTINLPPGHSEARLREITIGICKQSKIEIKFQQVNDKSVQETASLTYRCQMRHFHTNNLLLKSQMKPFSNSYKQIIKIFHIADMKPEILCQ